MNEVKKLKAVNIADIVRTNGPIQVPENMPLKDAARLLVKKAEEEEQVTSFRFDFNHTLPNDGGWALKQVLDQMFGNFATTEGKTPWSKPATIAVESGINGETTDIPWGAYALPHDIHLSTEAQFNKQRGMWQFVLVGECQKQFLPVVNGLVTELRSFLRTNSLYRGKAVRVEFSDEDGEKLDEIRISFVDLGRYDESQAIFGTDIDEEIKALIYGPLSSPDPKKTGVLLSGDPGVGKTLVMAIAARKAQQAGRTVIYTESRDFTTALRFAASYEGHNGALVVCEDIDRVLAGKRNAAIDSIYNAMDGPDTKHTNVSVLLTTNDLSVIPDPFLRPGRVRQTLELTPPDQEAVLLLLDYYGGPKLDVTDIAQLKPIAQKLAGRIPAVIADVMTRAFDIAEYKGRTKATLNDVEIAERSMSKQLRLLDARNRVVVPESEMVLAARVLASALKPEAKSSNGSGKAKEDAEPAFYTEAQA